ncbi:MAG: outer membrane beta-barrel domain-containing protein [Bdellovibrionales bacterium]|nr:outer membrane beta-barrel domain-containing protein [Bdellovibrionales bacterium]
MRTNLKSWTMFLVFPFSALFWGGQSYADLMEDFDSLGGNDVLLERARALQPDAQIEIVQDRVVNRHSRSEFLPEYGNVIGGDVYMNTQYVGLNYDYHINPHWSVGVKYSYFLNELGSEGHHLIERIGFIPELDWPKQSYMGLVNYYPIYGKFSFGGYGIVHFDFYVLAGYGSVDLKSGPTEAFSLGGGVGFWLSQHLSSRLELRYLNYDSERFSGASNMKLSVLNFGIGYLL